MQPAVRMACRIARATCMALLGCAIFATVPRATAAESSTWPWQNRLPGAYSSGSLDSHAQADVSLARGWVHYPAVAPGLVFGGGYGGFPIVAGGSGLVAYEQQGGGFRIYASATGRSWTQLPSPSFGPRAFVNQLFIVGQRFIITGETPAVTRGHRPRIWASVNGGRTWKESAAKLQVNAVVPGARGVIAFVSTRSSTQLWTSADGVNWQQLRVANPTFASASVMSATRGGPGFVAGGTIAEKSGRLHATIWTSRNGLNWTEVPNAATVFAGSVTGISQVVAGPAGVVAVAEVSGGERDGIWASRDGVHWRRAHDSFITTPGMPSLPLAVWRGGFAEIQDTGTGAELYASPDGLSWTRLGGDSLFGGSAWATALIAFHGGLAALGAFAPHPLAACLSTGNLVLPHPSTFLWTPQASQTASAPTLDPFDPWALRLLPQDFPAHYLSPFGSHPYLGQYVNLCRSLPALGPHRAYALQFGSDGVRGLVLDIVTQRTTSAEAAFKQVDRLVAALPWVTKVQRVSELGVTTPIGDASRVFSVHVSDYVCGDLERSVGDLGALNCTTVHYSASVVVWRHGRVIGLVVTDQGQSFAMDLARKLLARSEHPSD